MNRLPILILITFLPALSITRGGEYKGAVGRMAAVFSIDFHDNGTVSGTYSYPARKGVVYSLSGNNPRSGELYLEEYTGRQLSAKCYLSKRVTDNSIIWEGKMHNTDGRKLDMHFSRSRESSTPAPSTTLTSTGGSTYSGNVGKLKAEYSLTWGSNGRVSGTYTYPTRSSGTVYKLEGFNREEGKLYLEEYTGSKLSAKCALVKEVSNGNIIWRGTMFNTDGRELPMTLIRKQDQSSSGGVSAMASSLTQPDWYSRVERSVNWDRFPQADVAVERVPIRFSNDVWVSGKVKSFSSRPGELKLTYVLSVRNPNDFNDVRFEGPEVSFRAARHVPIPVSVMIGKEIYMQYDGGTGELLALTLDGFAMTHFRKTEGGKLEIRGLLDTDEFENFYEASASRKQQIIQNAPSIEFVPDKVAMDERPSSEPMFRNLRIVRDYGISIQTVEAGPGSLELEGLSLEEPNEPRPWVSLEDEAGWNQVPLNQRTGEAG